MRDILHKAFFLLSSAVCCGLVTGCSESRVNFPQITLTTGRGELISVFFINHGSVAMRYNNLTIHVDPVEIDGRCSYSGFPKADYIFITHEHFDHLDVPTIEKIKGPDTIIYANANSCFAMEGMQEIANGKEVMLSKDGDFKVLTVPAYNTTPGRELFHPKGNGNGYVFKMGDKIIYVSGDTEDVPEMASLKGVDLALLSVNQPYTMTVGQCVNAALMIQPKLLIPYHLSRTNLNALSHELDRYGVQHKIYEVLR